MNSKEVQQLKCKKHCAKWEICVRRSLGLDMPQDMRVENCRDFERKKDD